MERSIQRILTLMEDMPTPGMTSVLSGGSSAQQAQQVGMDIMPGDYAPDGYEEHECGEEPVSSDLLELAQELIMQAGGADRAREIIDKVQDVQEVLNIDDAAAIAHMADFMPEEPDLPTGRGMQAGSSQMYAGSQTPGGGSPF